MKDKKIECRKCIKCCETLNESNFYILVVGKSHVCKPCKIKTGLINYSKDREKNIARMTEYNKGWIKTERGKQVKLKSTRRMMKKYPEKFKSRTILRNAVATGKIDKSKNCTDCGIDGVKIEGHHPDHNIPLEVIWLCTKCHRDLHKLLLAHLNQEEK